MMTAAVLKGLQEPQTARLTNGLRVVHMRIPGAVAVGASLGVDVGSADEPDSWAGISHFLEHLVFRGTAAFNDSIAIGQAIEAVGGDFNAFTGKSYTQYICSAPRQYRDLVTQIPAELVVRPLFRQEDVEDERPVVIREIGLSEDSAGQRVSRGLEQASWPDSPMARPIIGRPETLDQVTASEVRRYWQTHYQPAKATFALAGDLSLEEALALVEQAVGRWPAGPADVPPPSAPAFPNGGPVRLELMEGRQETVLALGTSVGPWRCLDQAGISVLAALAGEGEGSLLIRDLVRRRGILHSGGALAWLNRDAGVFGLNGSARPENVMAVTEGLLAILRRLQETANPADFRRAVGYVRGDTLRQWQRPLDVAIQLCHQALMGDTHYGPLHDLRELETVTPERVQALAQQIFAPGRLRLALAGPATDREALSRLLAAQAV
jgi:predicted Zn-dependent peptidase